MIKKTFKYRQETFHFQGSEKCSIMRSIEASGQFYEADFLEAIERHTDSKKWVVDVGAHIGNHAIYWAKAQGMKVLAFEANPASYRLLKENLEKNGVAKLVSALNTAVGSEAGFVTLTPLESEDPGTFSMMRPTNKASFQCKVVKLDDYLNYFETRVPGIIKIDVEGAEEKVIRGALKTLQMHRPVVTTEVMKAEEVESIGELLAPLGYRPIGIYNSTPTVVWSAMTPGSSGKGNPYQELLQIVRYGVTAGMHSIAAQHMTRNLQKQLKVVEGRIEVISTDKTPKLSATVPKKVKAKPKAAAKQKAVKTVKKTATSKKSSSVSPKPKTKVTPPMPEKKKQTKTK